MPQKPKKIFKKNLSLDQRQRYDSTWDVSLRKVINIRDILKKQYSVTDVQKTGLFDVANNVFNNQENPLNLNPPGSSKNPYSKKRLQGLTYMDNLLGRIQNNIDDVNPTDVENVRSMNKQIEMLYPKNVKSIRNLLNDVGLQRSDVDSIAKYAPNAYKDYNLGLVKPFLPKGQNNQIPELSLGGIALNAGSGALGGAALGLPGIIVGGAIGLGKGLLQHFGQKKQVSEADALALEQKNEGISMAQTTGNMGASNPFAPTFPFGGMAGDNLIKIQKNETVQQPDGSVIQANAGTHAANQDTTVNVVDGSKVFMDEDKLAPVKGGPTFAEIHADLTRRINKIKNKK